MATKIMGYQQDTRAPFAASLSMRVKLVTALGMRVPTCHTYNLRTQMEDRQGGTVQPKAYPR